MLSGSQSRGRGEISDFSTSHSRPLSRESVCHKLLGFGECVCGGLPTGPATKSLK